MFQNEALVVIAARTVSGHWTDTAQVRVFGTNVAPLNDEPLHGRARPGRPGRGPNEGREEGTADVEPLSFGYATAGSTTVDRR